MTRALKFENIGKQYRLGEVGTGTISRDLERVWAKMRGKPDPHALIGEVNNREEKGGEFVWALKDINLDIEQGEVFGIIGRNGAGKSTLLKLLSRVTAPTTGRIRAKGRIASLLEVGTGFHPELTGRENIFLNGAILGMTKQEIKRRLDEIVEFSGCAKYIDTPAKRYSSGMTVRLGFAVAAHLECEILVIDEVLAVGDASFQKKCIGRMSEVASGGKTVLFVSHNMQSVEQLCTRACVIEQGQLAMVGGVTDAITEYFGAFSNQKFDEYAFIGNDKIRRGSGVARFSSISIQNKDGEEVSALNKGEPARIVFTAIANETINQLRAFVRIHSGLTRQEVTSIDEIVVNEMVGGGSTVSFAIDFDTSSFRPGIYPLLYWLGDGDNQSLVYDVVDNATRPLSIIGDGKGRHKGVFDIKSSVVEPELVHARNES